MGEHMLELAGAHRADATFFTDAKGLSIQIDDGETFNHVRLTEQQAVELMHWLTKATGAA